MKLSRDKYVANNDENVVKLVKKVMENMDIDDLRKAAYDGLTNHYIDNDQCFIDDYYEIFEEEDPRSNRELEEELANAVVYHHGFHSNPCVVGEIYIPHESGSELVVITHNMVYEDYGDNLCDITKVWDAHVQGESYSGRASRYDTDYDSCIHIPLDMGKHTALANMVLKRILADNNIEFVALSNSRSNQLTLEEFYKLLDK